MRAPFDRVAAPARPRVLGLLASTSLVMLVLLHLLDRPLRNSAAPAGGVSLQTAGLVDGKAAAIVASWSSDQRLLCAFGLGLDFLFLVVYPAAVAAGCVFAGERLRFRGVRFGAWAAAAAWVAVAAGVCDVVENTALLAVLRGRLDLALPAAVAAVSKFILLTVGLLYAVIATVLLRTTKKD